MKTKASYRGVTLSRSIEKVPLEQIQSDPLGPEGSFFTTARGGPLRRQQLQYACDVAAAGMG